MCLEIALDAPEHYISSVCYTMLCKDIDAMTVFGLFAGMINIFTY